MTNLTTKQKKANPTTTVSACCGAEVETRYSSFIDGNQYTCTKCRLVNCDVVERPTPTNPPTETVSDCQHNWKKTFCGDGCKEHPGVWEVCLNCNDKRRIV